MSAISRHQCPFLLFFFNDPATTEIYTLSLHDALPICNKAPRRRCSTRDCPVPGACAAPGNHERSEEHTSELQSHSDLVCRLLLEKKKKKQPTELSSNTASQTTTH